MDQATTPTVLVIEDHDSVRIAISRFLKAGGFEVFEAATPAAAATAWAERANGISLLLVDIDLVTISGPDLVETLFQQGPTVPVIFVTATDLSRARQGLRDFPNAIILLKPFTAEVLVKTVRDTLSAPSALSGFTTFFKRPLAAANDPQNL